MRALVTGGAGFIGSHLADKLIETGWSVDVIDDLSNGHREFVNEKCRFIPRDFSDAEILSDIKKQNYDYVFHLAAVPRVSFSVEHPASTNDINVRRTVELMEACAGNVKRFVFASSSSVYGGTEVLPTPEEAPKNPKSPYALQKSIIEDYLKMFYDLYGMDSVCLRFFNVFGPRQIGDSPYSTAVSAWLTAIKRGRSMRSDGDGTQSRDMCYVDNVVDACVKAATVEGDLKGECFNVACGDRNTNNSILEKLKTIYPYSESYSAPWRPGDVMHTQADLVKSEKRLGYKPLVTFWDGLDRTIQWYEKNWDEIKHMR